MDLKKDRQKRRDAQRREGKECLAALVSHLDVIVKQHFREGKGP